MLYTLELGMLAANCYILTDEENNAIIIDAGGSYNKLKNFLVEKEIKPAFLLLTHGHYDHIGAVQYLKRDYPSLPVYINYADEVLYSEYIKGKDLPPYMKKEDYEFFAPTDDLRNHKVLNLLSYTVEVIPCPGHTPGGVSFKIGNYLFTGDTLFKGSMGRTDLKGGDSKEIMSSLKRLYDLEGDCIVFPGHADSTTLDEERKLNPYMKLAVR